MPESPIFATVKKKFIACLSSEMAEDFLQLLLNLMSAVFLFDPAFRKNIDKFRGRYLFRSKDGGIIVAAMFADGKLEVREEEIDKPDITVTFKDGKALMGYLLAPKPDILGSILHQEVALEGNLNYLYKFAFMAKRLQLAATGKL